MSNREEEWYKTWFNSPYYHILYKKRNFSEAEQFIVHLLDYLKPSKQAKCLDLACGNGRHSVFLNKNELNVTGVDLSPENINTAKKFENENLHFFIHDMREIIKENEFDFIFNLFTSFGYFSTVSDNLKVLNSIHKMLNNKGKLILDFMNVHHELENLVEKEDKIIDDIHFKITKNFDGKFITKRIRFSANNHDFDFEEKVQAITKNDFEEWMLKANLKIQDCFGNYSLAPFNKNESKRLILIANKI